MRSMHSTADEVHAVPPLASPFKFNYMCRYQTAKNTAGKKTAKLTEAVGVEVPTFMEIAANKKRAWKKKTKGVEAIMVEAPETSAVGTAAPKASAESTEGTGWPKVVTSTV